MQFSIILLVVILQLIGTLVNSQNWEGQPTQSPTLTPSYYVKGNPTQVPTRTPTYTAGAPTPKPTAKPTNKPTYTTAKFIFQTTDRKAQSNVGFAASFGTVGFIGWMATLYFKLKQDFLWYSRSKYIEARVATDSSSVAKPEYAI